MVRFKHVLTFLAFPLLLTACGMFGEEVGRLPVNEASTSENGDRKEITLNLKKGDEITIWSDMDLEFDGNVSLMFKVEVLKDDKAHLFIDFDPTDVNVTLGEYESIVGNHTNWSYEGKNTTFPIEEDGAYTFKAILLNTATPSLKLKKAELIFKK